MAGNESVSSIGAARSDSGADPRSVQQQLGKVVDTTPAKPKVEIADSGRGQVV